MQNCMRESDPAQRAMITKVDVGLWASNRGRLNVLPGPLSRAQNERIPMGSILSGITALPDTREGVGTAPGCMYLHICKGLMQAWIRGGGQHSAARCLVLFVFRRCRRRQQPRDGSSNPSSFHTLPEIIMHPSLVRRQLGGIVPPKVASPTLLVRFLGEKKGDFCHVDFSWVSSVQTGGHGGSLTPLVDFYSKLPKGPAPQTSFGGLKARYFNGKNASGAPILATIFGIFAIGYTIDYQSACALADSRGFSVYLIFPFHMTFVVHLSASPTMTVSVLWSDRN